MRRHRPDILATLARRPNIPLRKTIEEVCPTLCMIGKAMQAQHQAAAPRFEDREIEPVGANRPLTDPVSGLRVLPPVF